MKKVMFALMCAVMLFGTVMTASAEDWHGGIRSRIHRSKERIERGVEHGTLTRHDARKLNEELGSILDRIDRMKSDGHLDRREREKINYDLDRLDRDISREKHDNDRRPDYDHRRY